MKDTKTHTNTIAEGGGQFLWMLALLLVISACSENAPLSEKQKPEQEISEIDGKPIINIQATNLYENDRLDLLRDKLAASHGRSIVRALNEQTSLSSIQEGRSVAVKDLGQYAKGKSGTADVGSTHFRVTDPDGDTEDFVLTLRRYVKNPQQIAAKGGSSNQLSATTTYLAYSPDRFYLQDDDDGNEQWPVTFPAVAIDDSTDKISVTFNKDGLVSTSLDQNKGNSQSSEPQIVMMDATSAANDDTQFCPDGGCGGDGGGSGGGGDDDPDNDNPGCTEHARRGSTGINAPKEGTQTYFDLLHLRLFATGDGDGAAELQMFIRNDDDYAGECLNREYKYRFDVVWRSGNEDTWVKGADGNTYGVHDVNYAGVDYSFSDLPVLGTDLHYSQGFPLFDLTNKPGPWRFVLSDDDKDYKDFTHRREHHWGENIQTYDMSSGTWSEVFTGFSTHSIQYGSSDDPNRESGVRRITIDNVVARTSFVADLGDVVVARKNYSGPGGYFEYVFGLQAY